MIFVADEFAALLDRVTAGVVGRCLRRVVDSSEGLGAVVATSHEDLVGALRPDRIVWCDFRRVEVWRKKASHGKAVGFCGSGSLKERCRVSGRTRR
jgi:ABC-type ATPase with predicted acetyltransferase domain